MTRTMAEAQILGKMKEIVEICRQYDPEFEFIDLTYVNGRIMFNNNYWETDRKIKYMQEGGEKEDE